MITQQEITAFIEQTEAAYKQATKGFWYWDENLLITTEEPYLVMKPYYDNDEDVVSINICAYDKALIVNAKNNLPRALEIIREQAAEIERLKTGLRNTEKELYSNKQGTYYASTR